MNSYLLKFDGEKIFGQVFAFVATIDAEFNRCTLEKVIVTPEKNLWQITLRGRDLFARETLRAAENLLSKRYQTDVEISQFESTADEYAAREKSSPKRKRAASTQTNVPTGDKVSSGKKILLQATPAGLPFYKNFGFEELCKIPVYSDTRDVF